MTLDLSDHPIFSDSILPQIIASLTNATEGGFDNMADNGILTEIIGAAKGISYRLILDENGKITQVDPAAVCPDCSVHAKEADLLLILSGELHPLKALMTGRVTVRGSTSKLMNIICSLS